MTQEQQLIAEVLSEVNPDAILRRTGFRQFKTWFANWKERADAVLMTANAGTFHTERIVTEDDSETDVGCSPCAEAAARDEAARHHPGNANA